MRNLTYTEVILRPRSLQGQKVYPDDARSLIALALNGRKVSPEIFARQNDGKTIGRRINKHPPVIPIIFGGGIGFVRIYGIGEAGQAALNRDLGTIVSALADHQECPVTVNMKQGALQYRDNGTKVHRIGCLGLAKTNKVRGNAFFPLYAKYNKAPEIEKPAIFQEIVPTISEVIENGLAGIADQLMIDLPRNLGIRVLDGTLGITKMHAGEPGHLGVIRNLRFAMDGSLLGPWSVGHFRSHGYGMIRPEEVRR